VFKQHNDKSGGRQGFIFAGRIRHETNKAYLIAPRDYRLPETAAVWLPRSQTKILQWGDDDGIGRFSWFATPTWLAAAKGFFDPGVYRP
jgi:hypothetical protein